VSGFLTLLTFFSSFFFHDTKPKYKVLDKTNDDM